MPKTNSLYDLIKQKSQELGRPLKVVCDWDDCIQPFWPWIVFQSSPDKDNLDKFEGYFQAYFNPDTAENKEAVEFVKKIAKNKELIKNYYQQYVNDYGSKERFKAPFSTIAEDLLKALKERFIDKLLVVSSYAYFLKNHYSSKRYKVIEVVDGKNEKFYKTFGNFSNVAFDHAELTKNEEGKYLPRRWERIELFCPDFDIFIDDRPEIITETRSYFLSSDKIYVLPDYQRIISPDKIYDYQDDDKTTAPNIYHVKTTVSDLTDEDFAQAAEEYKQKQQTKLASETSSPAERERERESIWKQPYLYLAFVSGVILLGIGIYWLLSKRNKKS